MQKYAIIVAGGVGKRFGSDTPKQFLLLNGRPILSHTIERFYQYSPLINIIVVLPKEQIYYWSELCKKYNINTPHKVVEGGRERFFSVQNGLQCIENNSLVAIHDGVRPFVSTETLRRCFDTAKAKGNAIPIIDVVESIRLTDNNTNRAINREYVKIVQTPQVFSSNTLIEAYKQPYTTLFSDDASVVEAMGVSINLVEGNKENIKITTQLDLMIGEIIISKKNKY